MTITSRGGGLQLTGRVIGFDGTYLTLESRYGPLTIIYENVACDGANCPDPETWIPQIRIAGAARMADVLMPGLIEAFARAEGFSLASEPVGPGELRLTLFDGENSPAAQFALRSATTAEGFADLVAFEADVVLAVREVSSAEIARAEEVGLPALDRPGQSRIVGLDALVPVVSPLSDIEAIALGDLATAFAGVRAEPLAKSLHLTADFSGIAEAFAGRVMAPVRLDIGASVVRHPDPETLNQVVGDLPDAVGIATVGRTGRAQAVPLTDTCGFRASPTLTALKTEDYPLTLPLFLYLGQQRQPRVMQDFLDWLRSPAAHLVVRRAGFVDQGPIPIPLDAQGQRFANAIKAAGPELSLAELKRMTDVLTAHTRLSITFRFEAGLTRLDAASRSNLSDLARAIRVGEYNGRRLLLAGFSDGQGDHAANLILSRERAVAVAADLAALLGGAFPDTVEVVTNGFGEALPMGCDDTFWGRSANRRVELWVSD